METAPLGFRALAGGTDLFPNMKRRQQTPATVVALRGIAALHARQIGGDRGLTIGALTRLSALEHDGARCGVEPLRPIEAARGVVPADGAQIVDDVAAPQHEDTFVAKHS